MRGDFAGPNQLTGCRGQKETAKFRWVTQMLTILSFVTVIGAVLGTLTLLISFTGSAPQTAAGAATAVALVVIPYCLAKLVWMSEQRKETQAILAALKAQKPHTSALPTLNDRVS